MHRSLPLFIGSLLLLFPGYAFLAEPPEKHEEWQGSIGALWMQYPLNCAVWGKEEERVFRCTQEENTVDLTIRRSQGDPLLHAQGTILGKTIDARAVKKGDILAVSGTYDTQVSSLPLTIGGTAEDFTFSGTYDSTPFQGQGSYTANAMHVSLSFTKTFPITGTLDLRRSDSPASFPSGLAAFSSSTGTGMALTETGALPPPTLPLLSSGTIEGATHNVVEQVQDAGQSLMGFSRVLTIVFQTIFAILVVLLLITFGILLHRLKNQSIPSSPFPSPKPVSPKKPQGISQTL